MLIAVVAGTALLPASAARAASGWNAEFVAQSDTKVWLESGETTTVWFEFRNRDVNGAPWERHDEPNVSADVRLGTTSPRDRSSVFAHSSWIAPHRAARLDQASVPLE